MGITVGNYRKLWLYEATRNEFWTAVRFRPGPPKAYWAASNLKSRETNEYAFDGPDQDFDRAKSTEVDNSVGDDRKSSKTK